MEKKKIKSMLATWVGLLVSIGVFFVLLLFVMYVCSKTTYQSELAVTIVLFIAYISGYLTGEGANFISERIKKNKKS